MPCEARAYTWRELVQAVPDGVYQHAYTQACGRSTTQLWVQKEGGVVKKSGYRHFATLSPPKNADYPPPMVDDHSLTLWVVNGEAGGYWYKWYPPLEWNPAWDNWEPTPPPPLQVKPGHRPFGDWWRWERPFNEVPTDSAVLLALYAALNINGRWQEKEKLIWREGEACVLYAGRALKCPWPPAEARLLYEAEHRDGVRGYNPIENLVEYAYVVLRRRWPEAERYIKDDKFWWDVYRYWVLGEDRERQA